MSEERVGLVAQEVLAILRRHADREEATSGPRTAEPVGEGQPRDAEPEPEGERWSCSEGWYGEPPRLGVGMWPCGAAVTDAFHETHKRAPEIRTTTYRGKA